VKPEVASRQRVVVVGGGFAGLNVVRSLRRAPVDVTLVDRQNFHLFQPLAYQVATGSLSAPEIAAPLRAVLRRQENAEVLLAEVTGFDLGRREVLIERRAGGRGEATLAYDTLVVAGGSHYSYFGHDEWQPFAPELKSLDGALDIRSRILSAFEAAELEDDDRRRQSWLTFVVVGAGPTGVEMAGQIAELAHDSLRRDFRRADTATTRVLLVEAAERVLTAFPPSLSAKAQRSLERLGVTPLVDHTLVDVDAESVTIRRSDGDDERIPTHTVVWAAGVTASELAAALAREAGVEPDRAGRIDAEPDLTLPSHPEVFAIGDMARVLDAAGDPLPGLAPVAIQEGRYVARAIRERLDGRTPQPFRYRDKGNLATIGRSSAVADLKGLKVSGFAAWVLWLVVHLFYLIGFQNRLLVVLRWTFSFVTHGRGARLIDTAAPVARGHRGALQSPGPAADRIRKGIDMEVGELLELYQQAQEARDESVRKLLAQSAAQAAAAKESLAKAKEKTSGARHGHDDGMGAALADRAHAELAAFAEASEKAVKSGSHDTVHALAAESLAAEALAAEAIASETLAAEASEGRFAGEPFAVEAAVAEAVVAEGLAETTAALQTFVDRATRAEK
jgi:NADH:quinone reductase (non-electrogenic)